MEHAEGSSVAVAARPGVSNTELTRNTLAAIRLPVTWLAPLLTQKPEMGALPALRAATDPTVTGGQYYGPGGLGEIRGYPKPVTSSPGSHDQAVQQRLWTVSAVGRKEGEYSRVTYDYALAAARALHTANPTLVFVYVSGEGIDSTGRSRQMWARVKGRTENDHLATTPRRPSAPPPQP